MRLYLRAYMAGIALPTMVVPLVIAAVAMQHPSERGFHLEDVLIFPIGLAPNAWGLWNALYLRLRRSREVPIGVFGAALVPVIAPAAFALQAALGKMLWSPELFAVGFPITLALYYLAWKHIVSRFNDLLGIG